MMLTRRVLLAALPPDSSRLAPAVNLACTAFLDLAVDAVITLWVVWR